MSKKTTTPEKSPTGTGFGAIPASPVLRYALALVAVGVAVLLRWALNPVLGMAIPYLVIFPAMVIVAVTLGAGPALVTTIIGVAIAESWFVAPAGKIVLTASLAVRFMILLVASLFVARVGEKLRAARAKAEADAEAARRAEEALRHNELILAQAGKMANLGAWEVNILDPDDIYSSPLRWSDEVYRIFGYEPGEVEMTIALFFERVPPDERQGIMDVVAQAIERKQPYNIEHSILRPDGSERIVCEFAEITFDDQGRPAHILGAVQDITERKQVEEALRQAKEAAEAAARTKSQFLANMSHELRTPMTGVLGMLDLALFGKLEAEQREFIDTARTSARSLVRILNDILDLTKIEMGKFSIESKPFSIRESVEHTFNILLPVAKGKGLDLNFTVAENVPQTMVGDQTRLNQVLTNLAANAVKFTETGKVTLRVKAGDSIAGAKREVTFSVADTGIGIPDDKRDLLFRVFSQVDESHTRSYGGSGLGLAISKVIVERMGGEIDFTSEEGKGSVFTFNVPFGEFGVESDAISAAGRKGANGEAPRTEERAKSRLLVAEDDQTIIQVLGTMLRRSNYEVDFAENGQMVVELWENGIYDLILMDVQMPRMNGFEATAAIREIERARGGHIPIIAMTAHAFKEDEERCLGAGMDAYISKPIDFKACLRLIEETLKKHPAASAERKAS